MNDDNAKELLDVLKQINRSIQVSAFWIGVFLYFITLASCSRMH